MELYLLLNLRFMWTSILTLTLISFRLLIIGCESSGSFVIGTRLISMGIIPLTTASARIIRCIGHFFQNDIDQSEIKSWKCELTLVSIVRSFYRSKTTLTLTFSLADVSKNSSPKKRKINYLTIIWNPSKTEHLARISSSTEFAGKFSSFFRLNNSVIFHVTLISNEHHRGFFPRMCFYL